MTPTSASITIPISSSFEWDELVELILKGQVIPIIGEALLVAAGGQSYLNSGHCGWPRRLTWNPPRCRSRAV